MSDGHDSHAFVCSKANVFYLPFGCKIIPWVETKPKFQYGCKTACIWFKYMFVLSCCIWMLSSNSTLYKIPPLSLPLSCGIITNKTHYQWCTFFLQQIWHGIVVLPILYSQYSTLNLHHLDWCPGTASSPDSKFQKGHIQNSTHHSV